MATKKERKTQSLQFQCHVYFCMEVDFWDLCSLIFATKCLNLFFESKFLSLSRFGGQRSKMLSVNNWVGVKFMIIAVR